MSSYEDQIAKANMDESELLNLLDYPSYFDLMDIPLPEERKTIIMKLAEEEIIKKNDSIRIIPTKKRSDKIVASFFCGDEKRFIILESFFSQISFSFYCRHATGTSSRNSLTIMRVCNIACSKNTWKISSCRLTFCDDISILI